MNNSLEIYEQYGFRFFPCRADKSPGVVYKGPPGVTKKEMEAWCDWRKESNQINAKNAELLMSQGKMIGAIPPDDVVIVDLDMHDPEKDGIKSFKEVKEFLDLNFSFVEDTFCVRTARNGYHLFFTVPKNHELTQNNGIFPGIDIKTSSGYVIAAGSPGYIAVNNNEPMPMPELLLQHLELECKAKKGKSNPDGPTKPGSVSVKKLKSILSNVDILNFQEHDRWMEFCMSAVAACGNSIEVIDVLTQWSYGDPKYNNDPSVPKRLFSFAPDGGITAGTFIHYLRKEGVSTYHIKDVDISKKKEEQIKTLQISSEKKEISSDFLDIVKPDYVKIAQSVNAAEFFIHQGNTSASAMLEEAIGEYILYVESEKKMFYFDGNKWVRLTNVLQTIYTIMERILKNIVGFKHEDGDQKNIIKCYKTINETSWKNNTLKELQQRVFEESVDWDSPAIAETITCEDGVIDFKKGEIKTRKGSKGEFRRSYIPYYIKDIINAEEPKHFIEFLHDIFIDNETVHGDGITNYDTARYSLGMCISGNAGRRLFHVWKGGGSNAKSTLIELMRDILGEGKFQTYEADLLYKTVNNNRETSSPSLAKFQGKYMCCSLEAEAGAKFSLSFIKRLTGGDAITARALYQAPVEFEATWQMILAANDLPGFDGYDPAFFSRLVILPFNMSFYKSEYDRQEFIDRGIKEKYIKKAKDKKRFVDPIKKERPAIIKYLIEAYVDLENKYGGNIPLSEDCLLEVKKYRKENDIFREHFSQFYKYRYGAFCATSDIEEYFNDIESVEKKISGKVLSKNFLKMDERLYRGQGYSLSKRRCNGIYNLYRLSEEELVKIDNEKKKEKEEEDKIKNAKEPEF